MMLREEEEAEEAAGGRKRVRVRAKEKEGKAAGGAVVRCQVPGCEVDISGLKGYHRRHRVCLQCANAPSVVIDGEDRRYCQQCGKFHILPDFDEGKRSCRRKLERHNRRRRRKPTDPVGIEEKEKEHQADLSTETICDDEPKEVLSSKVDTTELLLDSDDERGSPICSFPSSKNILDNSISFPVPAEAQIDEEKDNSKSALSSTIWDNRSSYSSLCPTGRISFKLYDWNPAEFPRRLRHQIFQWLASMPVELEGYIRPGCTILTVFISMPQFMWDKLSQDASLCINDLINAPGSLLLGRGNIFIFLSNNIIQVLKDGSSLTNIKMEVKAPKIHYVHPSYFEAGKPMELIACGSNLNRRKFRFLVSFAGKYMVHDSCFVISHEKAGPCDSNEKCCHDTDHEILRVRISRTDSDVFGPAFVEVENESGISNFIPILIGSKHICLELERMQVALCGTSVGSSISQLAIAGSNPGHCEHFVAKQMAISEFLVDIAWLLNHPCRERQEAIFNSVNLKRLTCLLKISIQNKLFNVLEIILNYLDVIINCVEIQNSGGSIPETDEKLLQEYVASAREVLKQRASRDAVSELRRFGHRDSTYCVASSKFQNGDAKSRDCLYSPPAASDDESHEDMLLIDSDRKRCYPHLRADWAQASWPHRLPHKITGTRLAVFVTVSVVMCLGACIALLHPQKAGEIAVSIRRCLFGSPP